MILATCHHHYITILWFDKQHIILSSCSTKDTLPRPLYSCWVSNEHSEAEVFYSSTLTLSCRLWSGNFSIFKFWLIEACTGMLVYRREHWLFFSFLCRFALLPFLDPEPPPSDASTASLNTTSRPWNCHIPVGETEKCPTLWNQNDWRKIFTSPVRAEHSR